MATVLKQYYTEAQYVQQERMSPGKSEYYHGEIFAMSGATREHNLVVANLVRPLGSQLHEQPCEVYPSDMRVRIPTGLYTYPDVTVVCGEPQFVDDTRDTLLNPLVVVEVLSKSTEAYDRGKKFEHYRSVDSIRHYVLVTVDRAHVEVYSRDPNSQWVLSEANGMVSAIELPAIQSRLVLADVYHKVLLVHDPVAGDESPPHEG